MTATANTAFTAAQFNTHVRDNLLETAPAKATTAGRIFVATGANSIAERAITQATVATAETTASTSYVALTTPGPAVTVVTGTKALVIISGRLSNGTAGAAASMGYAVSGASTIAADDTKSKTVQSATASNLDRGSWVGLEEGLTAGSNTFTAQYRVTSGTGTFGDRRIIVVGL